MCPLVIMTKGLFYFFKLVALVKYNFINCVTSVVLCLLGKVTYVLATFLEWIPSVLFTP